MSDNSDIEPAIEEKYSRLEKKYNLLLKASARLFERLARRHKSNTDLERTVLYLRSLYNQSLQNEQKNSKKSARHQEIAQLMDELGSSDEEIPLVQSFSIREDKIQNIKKRVEKERGKNEEKVMLWAKWMRQRGVMSGVEMIK